jgi:3-oxoacyl-[acyl-carrier-protein] synthase III
LSLALGAFLDTTKLDMKFIFGDAAIAAVVQSVRSLDGVEPTPQFVGSVDGILSKGIPP